MKPRVYHLKVHFVSTASRGKAEPEVTKEKGLHMIKKALRRTDVPGEVRRKLSGWLIDNSEKGDGSESSFVRVSVKERHEKYEAPLGLLINIVKVSLLRTSSPSLCALPTTLVSPAPLTLDLTPLLLSHLFH